MTLTSNYMLVTATVACFYDYSIGIPCSTKSINQCSLLMAVHSVKADDSNIHAESMLSCHTAWDVYQHPCQQQCNASHSGLCICHPTMCGLLSSCRIQTRIPILQLSGDHVHSRVPLMTFTKLYAAVSWSKHMLQCCSRLWI